MFAAATAPAAAQVSADVDAALVRQGVDASARSADVVVRWNELGVDIVNAEDQFRSFKGHRALAMMHLAMHDALNTIVPAYSRYVLGGRPRAAHPIAAAAQSGRDVLAALYPGQQAELDAELQAWLARVPTGALRDRGIELGRAAAAAILSRRAGDGFDHEGTYEFRSEAGQYETTPPWNGFVVQPGFRFARPFVLATPSQFRPAPPPALTSPAYAKALREVQESGAAGSSSRTADQTAYAIWWMEFAETSVNRLARQLTSARDIHLWIGARLFAQINMALFDTYVAVWDSKYEYNHWRPYTAVREADADGNPRTALDPEWESLRPAPPHPEYVSAHAAGCAASFGIVGQTFGESLAFTMESAAAPPGMPTRTFQDFRAAALECADSRVRLGYHFRYSTDAGHLLGRRIARYTLTHTLQKFDRSDADDRR
jgi:hypothetical protein